MDQGQVRCTKTTFFGLPYDVQLKIFGYLLIDDIKNCRLVCFHWYSCCDDRSITEKEKFVFRSGIYSDAEIEEILSTHRRQSGLNVDLIGVNVKRLSFRKFGSKLQTLQITAGSLIDSLKSTDIFDFLPNVTRFSSMHNCHTYNDVLFKALENVPEGVLTKLEMLECDGYYCPSFLDSNLWKKITPRLNSIHFPHVYIHQFNEEGSLLYKNSIKQLSVVQHDENIPLSQEEWSNLISFSRLEKLHVEWKNWPDMSFDLYSKPFSEQNHLQELVISLKCEYKRTCFSNILYKNPPKRILFCVLENCKNLKKFSFFAECLTLHLNETDTQKFYQAVSRSNLKSLAIPIILDDNKLSVSQTTLLSDLEFFEFSFQKHPGHDYCGNVPHSEALCRSLSKIFSSEIHLRQMKVDFEVLFPDYFKPWSLKTGKICNTNLASLEIILSKWTASICEYLLSWEFPNLRTLRLQRYNPFINCMADTYQIEIVEWLSRMPLLANVSINIIQDMSVPQWVEIIKHLLRLQSIEFFYPEKQSDFDFKECRDLFISCGTLKKVKIYSETNRTYCVNRTKKMTYIKISPEKSYKQFVSII